MNIQFLIHELKGPLDVLETNLKMLEKLLEGQQHLSQPLSKKTLERSKRNAAKLRQIILSLLEVGSSQAGQFCLEQFKVVETVCDILLETLDSSTYSEIDFDRAKSAPIASLKKHGIELEISDTVRDLYLYQDKIKFTFIVSNLVRNALHHTDSTIQIHLTLDTGDLVIDIIDDGPGVPFEDHKHMFKCYSENGSRTRSKRKGHGLGLATSRIMARHLKGDIVFVPEESSGAHFSLHLPLRLHKDEVEKADSQTDIEE